MALRALDSGGDLEIAAPGVLLRFPGACSRLQLRIECHPLPMRSPHSWLLISLLSCCAVAADPELPKGNLLFNGWGLTPAGTHAEVSDLPLKMIIAPGGK